MRKVTNMAIHTTCDGVKRRDFLKAGAIGTTGLTLASFLRMAQAGDVRSGKAKSAIFINLPGGPSHLDTFDLKPDMITVAKALSSAYLPIAAAVISDEIYQVIKAESARLGNFGTGYTYSGHPVPAAVALETLKIYQERDILGHVRAVSPRFLERLHALGDHPLVGETRGVGLIGGVQLVKNKATKEMYDPSLKVAPTVVNLAVEHGLLIRALPNDSIAACPPLIITIRQIDDLFDSMGRALDDMLEALTKQGEAAE